MLDVSDINTQPGHSADFSAVVVNPGYAHIVFVSAAVIPLAGYPVPRLVHLGLIPTIPIIGSSLQSDSGWPPSGLRMRPLAGAGLPHGEVAVAFGISGDSSGTDYAVAGLKIRYRVQGNTHYLTAWSAAVDCVNGNNDLASDPIKACDSVMVKVDNMTSKMAGLIPPFKYLKRA